MQLYLSFKFLLLITEEVQYCIFLSPQTSPHPVTQDFSNEETYLKLSTVLVWELQFLLFQKQTVSSNREMHVLHLYFIKLLCFGIWNQNAKGTSRFFKKSSKCNFLFLRYYSESGLPYRELQKKNQKNPKKISVRVKDRANKDSQLIEHCIAIARLTV